VVPLLLGVGSLHVGTDATFLLPQVSPVGMGPIQAGVKGKASNLAMAKSQHTPEQRERIGA